jgi:hypothetical protein
MSIENEPFAIELGKLKEQVLATYERLHAEIASLEHDRMALALRVYGESRDTYSPEVHEVMDRMEPLIKRLMRQAV